MQGRGRPDGRILHSVERRLAIEISRFCTFTVAFLISLVVASPWS